MHFGLKSKIEQKNWKGGALETKTVRTGYLLSNTLKELNSMGGSARPKDLLDRLEKKLDLTAYEKEVYEKTGHTRWKTFIRYYAIDLTKSGLITRSKGVWTLTEEGKKAVSLSHELLMKTVHAGYKAWKSQKGISSKVSEEVDSNPDTVIREVTYQEAIEKARSEISTHILKKNPYEIQDLTEFLLAGMGYYVSFNSPKGRDGGIDLIAYRDPLGTLPPRIKVQVKHQKSKVGPDEVQRLNGILGSDVGLIVSTGGFTPEADREARKSDKHIDLMDLEKFIDLWEANYEKIPEEGKILLPLIKVSFLAPKEE